MASLGQKLRDERVRQEKDLRTIAQELRIGSRYLEAIETEEWAKLPGGFFNRSFVRQYAAYLGFDTAVIDAEFSSLTPSAAASLERAATPAIHDPRAKLDEERRIFSVEPLSRPAGGLFDSRMGLALAGLVLVVAGGGALSLMWDRIAVSRQTTPEPPTVSAPAPAVLEPTPAPTVETQPTATTEAEPASNLTLNIEASERTWIEVTADGKRIFAGVLLPGEVKSIETEKRAKMLVGNAGGVSVRKSGRDIGPIGPRGQVRLVNITPEAVEITNPLGRSRENSTT